MLATLMPMFILGFLLVFLAAIVPVSIYVALRNGRVTNERKVLTPDQWRQLVSILQAARGERHERQDDDE